MALNSWNQPTAWAVIILPFSPILNKRHRIFSDKDEAAEYFRRVKSGQHEDVVDHCEVLFEELTFHTVIDRSYHVQPKAENTVRER